MAKLSKIQDLQNEYHQEIILCDIEITKESIFEVQGSTVAEKIVAVQTAKKELYQQFIKNLDKLKRQ